MNACFGWFIVAVMFLVLQDQTNRAAGAEQARKLADTPANRASAAVREALQREIYGLKTDREQLLASAAEEAPQFAAARWHQGYVRDGKQGWSKHDAFLESSNLAARLAAYERQRAQTPDTVAGQMQLADWCAKHHLQDQQRAHLTRVIDLAPDHAGARSRLGFVPNNGVWIGREEIARQQSRLAERRAALQEWQPKLRELRQGLEHRSPERRAYASVKLNEIRAGRAVPAIEEVFAGAPDEVLVPALDALTNIQNPDASLLLAQCACFGQSQYVRNEAATRLGKRELDSYVPQILASMSSPIVSRFMATVLPSGRIGYRHAFVREGANQVDVLLMDTEYRRLANLGGNRRETANRAFAEASQLARQREQQMAAQNRMIGMINDRMAWVLKTATGEDLPAQPESWWQWWHDQNEVFLAGAKPQAVAYRSEQVAIEDYVRDVPSGVSAAPVARPAPPPRRYDCLAAGTLIWTVKGPQTIESIRVGDLVLSQHPDSGELAFKPVLRTTIRPKSELVQIAAGSETWQTSGGHLFWVAGEGWVKSRDLQPGQVLHSVSGPVRLTGVGLGIEAETFNLIVADFGTYFVGQQRVLSHDNSVRTATRAVVPGLEAE